MDRQKAVMVAVGVILLLAAAVFFLIPDQDETIKDVREKANQSSYQVNYTVDFNQSLMPGEYDYSSFEAYSDGDRYKNIIRYERNGTEYRNVSFLTSDQTLRCNQVQRSIDYFDCELDDSKTDFFYGLIDLAIQYSDSKGRIVNTTDQCYQFNYSVRKTAVPGAQNITWSPNIGTCLDREEGYVRDMNITGEIMGENNSITQVQLMEIEAESVNESFEGSAEPQVDMVTDTNCNAAEPNMDLLLMEDLGDVTVTVGGYNETFDISTYKPFEVFLPPRLLVNGTNSFQIYSDNGMREATCEVENLTG